MKAQKPRNNLMPPNNLENGAFCLIKSTILISWIFEDEEYLFLADKASIIMTDI